MLNFLIVDDHEIVRAGVKNVLRMAFKPDEIAEACNELTTRAMLLQKKFEMIIMDVQMPQTDTIGLVSFIRESYPDSKLLMFSMTPEKIYANKFYNIGVMGDTYSRFENPFGKLSIREMEVVLELMKGLNQTQIANQLSINSSTLASHKAHIFNKLDVNNLSELIAIGRLYNVIKE